MEQSRSTQERMVLALERKVDVFSDYINFLKFGGSGSPSPSNPGKRHDNGHVDAHQPLPSPTPITNLTPSRPNQQVRNWGTNITSFPPDDSQNYSYDNGSLFRRM